MMMTSELTRLSEFCLATSELCIKVAGNHAALNQHVTENMANNGLSAQIHQTFCEPCKLKSTPLDMEN